VSRPAVGSLQQHIEWKMCALHLEWRGWRQSWPFATRWCKFKNDRFGTHV